MIRSTLFVLLINSLYSQCYEKEFGLKASPFYKKVDCLLGNQLRKYGLEQAATAPTNASSLTRGPSPFNSANRISAANGTFQIDLTCVADQTTCNEVEYTFSSAAQFLSNVLVIKTPITVDARYYSFCTQYKQCVNPNSAGQQITLGQATPARTIQLKGDDGISRLYPQALVKQIDSSKAPGSRQSYDIFAEFNADAQFWFQRSNRSIAQNQVDFLLVVSHEMIHGLGFTSSYSDYFNESPQVLTPNPQIETASNGQIRIAGFVENIFDKYMVRTDNNQTITSTVADQLNNWAASSSLVGSEDDAINAFQSSSAYQVGQQLLTLATQSGSLGLNLNGTSGPLILETSLKPFQPSSSVSHVDLKKYANTKEFLMQWQLTAGTSLADSMRKVGGQWSTAPYGPMLIQFLGEMGYPTNENPNPDLVLQLSHSVKLHANLHLLCFVFISIIVFII